MFGAQGKLAVFRMVNLHECSFVRTARACSCRDLHAKRMDGGYSTNLPAGTRNLSGTCKIERKQPSEPRSQQVTKLENHKLKSQDAENY